jgi:hypothetical protein
MSLQETSHQIEQNDDVKTHKCNVYGCSILNECDTDFGDIVTVDTDEIAQPSTSLPSRQTDSSTLSHLHDTNKIQLLALIDEFADCFTETPGFCSLETHTLKVSPDLKPKRFKAYKVPENLKPAVSA